MTPFNFRVRKVEKPDAIHVSETPELEKIVDVLARAFSTDAFTAIVTGNSPDSPEANPLARPLCRSTAIAGLLGGEVYVAETMDTPAKIVGCALWFRPGRALYDSEDQVQFALKPLLALFNEDLQRWWDGFIPQYENCVNSALGEGSELNSWRLQTIAVDPDYQRQRVGTLLVNTVKEQAAATKTPLCVDCSEESNVDVYERLGFELMPKGKGGRDVCRKDFTGLNGDIFRIWVLSRV
ncbi:hypothetical protein C8R44DRAFT_670203 [Mycena epipterygia]|nr:hypothetical protein C8R44DRAFT_670203 [Mycena epipterygia]